MKRIHMILLALFSALLLSIPYFQWGTGLVLMGAFIPLLFIEEHIAGLKKERKKEQKGTRRRSSVILYAYLAFGLFVIYGINMFGDALRDILDPRLRGGAGRYGVSAKKEANEKK